MIFKKIINYIIEIYDCFGMRPVIILCKFLNVITFKLLLSSSNIVFNEDINSGILHLFQQIVFFYFLIMFF